jgi:hypothetical protein
MLKVVLSGLLGEFDLKGVVLALKCVIVLVKVLVLM